MSLKRSRMRSSDEDLDPMSSITNMTDLMLVLAVGFLIFAVMSTGMQDILENNQQSSQASLETVEIEPGQEITEQLEQIDSSTSGYQRTGTVYTDPKTGKQYMTAG